MEYRGAPCVCRSGSKWPIAAASDGTTTRVGAMKSDVIVQLENTVFALLVGTILLGVPALTRLLGLG
jgi:hypothetical protein